jgi:hypothetical protein
MKKVFLVSSLILVLLSLFVYGDTCSTDALHPAEDRGLTVSIGATASRIIYCTDPDYKIFGGSLDIVKRSSPPWVSFGPLVFPDGNCIRPIGEVSCEGLPVIQSDTATASRLLTVAPPTSTPIGSYEIRYYLTDGNNRNERIIVVTVALPAINQIPLASCSSDF